ncbi:hybrid sensor histidine kinase/response regulator [Clostridium lacusfryxellense]|uniref:hybrid sensor histidine kinase/response regulator n=1 Tax=Clostridium lacusfryxellense TaxID=205328 RepID=UPI001C0AB303|nr:hybrid sensor histidine kinase/response regulator [Clostridium lacusfryxellense]MBU3113253.1 hybrid sensor histidine kinase/response regulator [Clostridium lacusfryxellense]
MEYTNKIKILIVDDDPTSRIILKKILSKVGYEITQADCGKDALEKIVIEKPNLVILDIDLPDITGYEVCIQIKSNPDTEYLPVLNISSYFTKEEDWIHGLECGADNYLTKPINPQVLVAIVKSMLKIQNTESKLRIALKDAESANDIKTQFLANISHELKTPINVIVSALQMSNIIIKDIAVPDIKNKLYKYSGMMKQNSYRLIRLINNLIDITKIDSGFINMMRRNVDIIKIVEDITLSVASFVESKQIELIFDTDIEEKITACDPDKVETIIFNLLSNATKFTNAGGKITVNIFDMDEYIIISVKDTGIGIEDVDKQKIFERFLQVDDTSHRNNEGSGIGLALVKSFVEMQGGEITVESTYGVGSNFIVKLPIVLIDEIKEKNGDNIMESYVHKMNIEFSDVYT